MVGASGGVEVDGGSVVGIAATVAGIAVEVAVAALGAAATVAVSDAQAARMNSATAAQIAAAVLDGPPPFRLIPIFANLNQPFAPSALIFPFLHKR